MVITLSRDRNISAEVIIDLYTSVNWSAAQKPRALINALRNSHSLVTAWDQDLLVGLGNAISDGHLVVYFPHLLVRPDYHGHGIGKKIVEELESAYKNYGSYSFKVGMVK